MCTLTKLTLPLVYAHCGSFHKISLDNEYPKPFLCSTSQCHTWEKNISRQCFCKTFLRVEYLCETVVRTTNKDIRPLPSTLCKVAGRFFAKVWCSELCATPFAAVLGHQIFKVSGSTNKTLSKTGAQFPQNVYLL